jgi:hypothetical protein
LHTWHEYRTKQCTKIKRAKSKWKGTKERAQSTSTWKTGKAEEQKEGEEGAPARGIVIELLASLGLGCRVPGERQQPAQGPATPCTRMVKYQC